jgi:hypothetical protein
VLKYGLVLLSALVLFNQRAMAWADRGHQIVGQIAEETIKPSTKDFVRGIMGLEPLSVSATFPDHVKDDPRYAHREKDPSKQADDIHDFGDFHFCEIPVGYDYDTKPVKAVKDCYGVITGAIAILKQKDDSAAGKVEKQIALRYLAHVMGDISMPLHVGNGLDRGGNGCQVKWQPDPKVPAISTNFHAFWDDNLVNYLGETYADPATGKKPARYMGEFMVYIRARHSDLMSEAGKSKYGAGDLKSWLMESATVRESGMYPDNPEDMKGVPKGDEPKHRKYCVYYVDQASGTVAQGSVVDPAAIPVLGKEYGDQYANVAEMQMLKGGLRLAATLDAIADDASKSKPLPPTLNNAEEDAILKAVQSQFKNK